MSPCAVWAALVVPPDVPQLDGASMAGAVGHLTGIYNKAAMEAVARNSGRAAVRGSRLAVVAYFGACRFENVVARRKWSDKEVHKLGTVLHRTMLACSTTDGNVETHLITWANLHLERPASVEVVEVIVRNVHPTGGAGNTDVEAAYAHVALVAMR